MKMNPQRSDLQERMQTFPEDFADPAVAYAMLERGQPLSDALQVKAHAEKWTEPEGMWFDLENPPGNTPVVTFGTQENGAWDLTSSTDYVGARDIRLPQMLADRAYDNGLTEVEKRLYAKVPALYRDPDIYCINRTILNGAGRFATNERYIMFRDKLGHLKIGPKLSVTRDAVRRAGFTEDPTAFDGSIVPVLSESQIPITVTRNYRPGLTPIVYSVDPWWAETSRHWRKLEQSQQMAAEQTDRATQIADTAAAATALLVGGQAAERTRLMPAFSEAGSTHVVETGFYEPLNYGNPAGAPEASANYPTVVVEGATLPNSAHQNAETTINVKEAERNIQAMLDVATIVKTAGAHKDLVEKAGDQALLAMQRLFGGLTAEQDAAWESRTRYTQDDLNGICDALINARLTRKAAGDAAGVASILRADQILRTTYPPNA